MQLLDSVGIYLGKYFNYFRKNLITCSKDYSCIVHDFDKGFRPIDNLCTNFTKFNQFGSLVQYSDKKPKKQVKFINFLRL